VKNLRLVRETRDLHVGLYGSQRLPAQHLLPPARWTVEIILALSVKPIPYYHPLRLLTTDHTRCPRRWSSTFQWTAAFI